jgi:succinate dehydrogenase/fumarate reductase flavoprotein subunit
VSADHELVVVGAGGAGLTAAIAAHDAGASVVVLEKSSYVGGTFAYSTGLTWIPNNHHMREEGADDSSAEALRYIVPRTSGRHDEAVLETFVGRGPDVIAYLEREGVPFEIVPGYPDEQADEPGGRTHGRYLSSPVFAAAAELDAEWREILVRSPNYSGLPASWREIQGWGGFGSIANWNWELLAGRVRDDVRAFGMSTAGYLLKAARARGIEIRLDTAAVSLLTDRGRVIGVTDSRGEEVRASRGVVLSTGSYDNDPTFKRNLEPHPPTVSLGAPTVDGSGLVMALELGAQFALLGGQLLTPAYHVEGEETDAGPVYRMLAREPGFPGSVIVNRNGERFCDESTITELRRALALLDPHTRSYPNHPAFFVFDQRWKDRYPLGPIMPGETPEWLSRADTASELARLIGVDEKRFETTLTTFNEGAAVGTDESFGRGESKFSRAHGDPEVTPNPCLRPLEPPLYALDVCVGIVGTNGGLVIDGTGAVQSVRGESIPGLYAAGNAAANLVGGLWYNAGMMNARGMIFGFVGARAALGAE